MKWLVAIGAWLAVFGAVPFVDGPHDELSSTALAWDMLAHQLGTLLIGIVLGYYIHQLKINHQSHSATEWTTTRRDQ